ncbi:Uncharacterised protein [Mycobacteroides abscessus subsp. abscessus]|uniref:hypothetical protein n=1 Tax=Mycobacteroides abscessus TaxID=36809 RepID=UPI00092B8126|nr:hypothetical protein [Mycobacteroides abscessus]SIC64352.1 Uncharacterised protein [Mycobacteroides abscessus subsp. abscessus]SIG65357.1 Uncharacterised protein [Mycobacteroides abscessus subsp. abscessus]
MRHVVAVDPTLAFVSLAAVAEDGTAECRRALGIELEERQHPAAAYERATKLAARVADGIEHFWGTPVLVVMRRQDPGTYKQDPHASTRLGLHWAIVAALVARGIPVAELGTISAGIALCGHSRGGHVALNSKVLTLYPDLVIPRGLDKSKNPTEEPDKRYRTSTVALALLGAVAVGFRTRVEPTEHLWDALRKGGMFPPSVPLPARSRANRTRSDAELKKADERAEAWATERNAETRTMRSEAFWRMEPLTSPRLKQEYERRVEAEIEALSDMSLHELEGMPTPEHDDLRIAVANRLAELNGEA